MLPRHAILSMSVQRFYVWLNVNPNPKILFSGTNIEEAGGRVFERCRQNENGSLNSMIIHQ